VAIGQQSFALRQKWGDWAEDTVLGYFKSHPESEIVALPYGERYSGPRKKVETDAVFRPDLLLVESKNVALLRKRGIDLKTLNLRELFDRDERLATIIEHALVGIEVKISFRYYAKGHVNFIIDEVRKKRYETWLSKVKGIGDVVVWFTLDKAFIAPMKQVLSEGSEEERSYEQRGKTARTKMTWNFPVEKADRFADVSGVELNKTIRASLDRSTSGSIAWVLDYDPGVLENVNLSGLRKLAEQVRRSSAK
jgi:hypothetical protein